MDEAGRRAIAAPRSRQQREPAAHELSGSDPHGLRSRELRDACAAVVVVGLGGLCFVAFDSAERITSWLLSWERLEFDDLLLTSFLALTATGWFAWRRWRDAARALAAQRASELEKARYVARLEELSAQLVETEQRERARIAELLHDEVGQTLYACRLQLERAAHRVQEGEARALLDRANELASAAMASTRELTVDLSPPVLNDLGLSEAIEWLVRRTESRFGLRARLVPGGAWRRIPDPWHAALFQSLSELLTNAAKHAGADEVEVSAFEEDGRIEICVRDDGRGFPARPAEPGFGLFSVERRMAWLGAELVVESFPGSGTLAALRLPPLDT
jgi:signal transduction histidine kinase